MSIPRVMGEVTYVDTEQMIEVDRAMVEDFHIDLIQMMENAGRNLAALARERFLDGDPIGKRTAIMAGSGGNGGGALVAARRLHNLGRRRPRVARPGTRGDDRGTLASVEHSAADGCGWGRCSCRAGWNRHGFRFGSRRIDWL